MSPNGFAHHRHRCGSRSPHDAGLSRPGIPLIGGASLASSRTLEAVVAHLRREAEIGGYTAAEEAAPVIASARSNLAELVGGRLDEVALTAATPQRGSRHGGVGSAGGNVARGGAVLVDRFAYLSHFAAIAETARLGAFDVKVLPSLPDGTINLAATAIDAGTSVVVATMVPTHCGNVNPIADLGQLCAAAGVPLFVDACQAVGQLHLDITELGCDVLTGTGRKFLRAHAAPASCGSDPNSPTGSAHPESTARTPNGTPTADFTSTPPSPGSRSSKLQSPHRSGSPKPRVKRSTSVCPQSSKG